MEKHFAATGFVMNRTHTKILMVYHKKLQKWAAPGGHLEQNEFPAEGAKREVFEETGVKVKILDCSGMVVKSSSEEQLAAPFLMLGESIPPHGDSAAHTHMDFIFLCEADDASCLKKREREVNEVKWMDWKELLEVDTFDSIKQFARLMLEGGDIKCVNSDSC